MSTIIRLAFLGTAAALGASHQSDVSATPIGQVVSLLEKLQKVVEKEGKEEAAAYDKFACFCKESAHEKQNSKEKRTEKLENMEADILFFQSKIDALNGEIQAANTRIKKVKEDQDSMNKIRDEQHALFKVDQKNHQDGLKAIQGAIDSIQQSRDNMKGAKFSLVSAYTTIATTMMKDSVSMSPEEKQEVVSFLADPSKPFAYRFQAHEIVTLLKKLQTNFAESLTEVEASEMEKRNNHDKVYQALVNELEALEDEVAAKSAQSAKFDEKKNAAEVEKTITAQQLKDDMAFLKELVDQCEAKARDWDERSKTRNAELQAIAEALDILKKDVVTREGTNKKLVGLVTRHQSLLESGASPKGDIRVHPVQKRSEHEISTEQRETNDDVLAGFLQVSAVKSKRQVMQMLMNKARILRSPVLISLVTRANADPFAKVRQLIQDLIDRLNAEADDEAVSAKDCKSAMATANEGRDQAQSDIEGSKPKIADLESEISILQSDINDLEADNAQLAKQSAEATELRNEEKAENALTEKEAEDAYLAVTKAIKVLSDFYGSNASVALVQGPDYVTREMKFQEGADREGNTVADRAPETYEDNYKGKHAESKGIIGILEVIQRDFERTKDTTRDNEESADIAFTKAEKERQQMITKNSGLVKTKTVSQKQKEGDLLDEQEALKGFKTTLARYVEELEILKPTCVDSGVDFKERQARRLQEIDALKQALQMLRAVDVDLP